MKKYTQKYFKTLVKEGLAHDITNKDFDTIKELLAKHNFNKIGYSSGLYGLNGGLIQDINSGELYAITARTSTLFQVF